MNYFISIVIAIYNEESNVKELTQRIYNSMESLNMPFELIYAIDGNDNSFDILKKIRASKNNLILNYSPKLRGFKKAFVKGFSLISKKATHVLTLDGDLNHQPEEIIDLIKEMKIKKSDVVIGSRYIKKGKIKKLALWKKSLSIFANFVIRFIFRLNVKDKTSGFRLYTVEIINQIIPQCQSKNFEFLLEILILSRKLDYKISEVPIIFKTRERGQSKFEVWKTMVGYFNLMLRYFLKSNKKPAVTKYVANRRARLILNKLKRLNKERIKILDVGCGDKYITNLIKKQGYGVVGIDKLTSKTCRWITQDPDYIMDATQMTFNDNSFDVVIALEIIEHTDCVSEMKRVLKPGGLFFCSTPSPSTDWLRKLLISFSLLENQDFEGHDKIINLKKIPMKLLKYKKMFFRTSQFGIFKKIKL